MRYLLFFLLLPLFATAQRETILHTTIDTTFSTSNTALKLDTSLHIGATNYHIQDTENLNMDTNDQLYSILTLNNGLVATIRRSSDRQVISVILQGNGVYGVYYPR